MSTGKGIFVKPRTRTLIGGDINYLLSRYGGCSASAVRDERWGEFETSYLLRLGEANTRE